MRPIIVLARESTGNYKLAALVKSDKDTENSKSPFSLSEDSLDTYFAFTLNPLKDDSVEVVAPFNIFFDTDELNGLTHIKVNGIKVKLTKQLLSKIKYDSIKISDYQEGYTSEVTEDVANTIHTIRNIEGYEEFVSNAEEIFGLVGQGNGDIVNRMIDYEGKKHLLLVGGAGLGKTYSVGVVSSTTKRKTFFKALDNGTESIDLLGHLIKLSDGSFAWKDGVVTQAFREASKGEKVILFLDELLRCPEREQSLLVGCLTPNSDNKLVLRTGRPIESTIDDGIVEEEVLEATLDNLWCIATTNQGSGYHTGTIDMALSDRFRIMELLPHKENDITIASNVISKVSWATRLTETQIDVIITGIFKVVDEINVMIETGNLSKVMTIRHITEAITTAKDKKDLLNKFYDLAYNLVDVTSSGRMNPEQLASIRGIIKDHIR